MLPSVHPTSWYDRQGRPGAPGAARPRCCRQCIRHRGMTGRVDLVRRGRPGRDAAVSASDIVAGSTWCAGAARPRCCRQCIRHRGMTGGSTWCAGAARPRCCRQCIRHRGMTGRIDLVRRAAGEMLPSVHPTSWYDRQGRPGAPGAARPRCCRQCIRHRGMTGRIDLVRRGRPG
ncbi:hypothetical protein J6590_017385 [Homalodisca vitripennis]|nr:hypothetical protein J6590_017385 [Homalodisca vitripennis]